MKTGQIDAGFGNGVMMEKSLPFRPHLVGPLPAPSLPPIQPHAAAGIPAFPHLLKILYLDRPAQAGVTPSACELPSPSCPAHTPNISPSNNLVGASVHR